MRGWGRRRPHTGGDHVALFRQRRLASEWIISYQKDSYVQGL